MRLAWSSRSQPQEIVPATRLFLPSEAVEEAAVPSKKKTKTGASPSAKEPEPSEPEDEEWLGRDVGETGVSGSSAGKADGSLSVTGGGSGIGGSADGFYFLYRRLAGDGTLMGRLVDFQGASGEAEAGLMIRESLAENAAGVFLGVTPEQQINIRRRLERGQLSGHIVESAEPGELWLKLERSGTVLNAFVSADGEEWTLIRSFDVPMNFDVYAGLAVSGRDAKAPGSATFDEVTLAPVPEGHGLQTQYFDDAGLRHAAVTRPDGTINFGWDEAAPDADIPADYFSARWAGEIEPEYSESYTFYVTSSGPVRLWVGGQLLIDRWKASDEETETSGTIAIEAGKRYPITLEYASDSGLASVRLSWASGSQEKEIVPASQLFLGETGEPAGRALADAVSGEMGVVPAKDRTRGAAAVAGESLPGTRPPTRQARMALSLGEEEPGGKFGPMMQMMMAAPAATLSVPIDVSVGNQGWEVDYEFGEIGELGPNSPTSYRWAVSHGTSSTYYLQGGSYVETNASIYDKRARRIYLPLDGSAKAVRFRLKWKFPRYRDIDWTKHGGTDKAKTGPHSYIVNFKPQFSGINYSLVAQAGNPPLSANYGSDPMEPKSGPTYPPSNQEMQFTGKDDGPDVKRTWIYHVVPRYATIVKISAEPAACVGMDTTVKLTADKTPEELEFPPEEPIWEYRSKKEEGGDFGPWEEIEEKGAEVHFVPSEIGYYEIRAKTTPQPTKEVEPIELVVNEGCGCNEPGKNDPKTKSMDIAFSMGTDVNGAFGGNLVIRADELSGRTGSRLVL